MLDCCTNFLLWELCARFLLSCVFTISGGTSQLSGLTSSCMERSHISQYPATSACWLSTFCLSYSCWTLRTCWVVEDDRCSYSLTTNGPLSMLNPVFPPLRTSAHIFTSSTRIEWVYSFRCIVAPLIQLNHFNWINIFFYNR